MTTTLHFPKIQKVSYAGPGSDDPLAFRHYNPDEVIDGKSMVPQDAQKSTREDEKVKK